MTLEELYKRFPVTNTGLQNEKAYRNCVGQEITVVAKLDNITTSDPSNEGFISIGQSFNTSMLTFLVYDTNRLLGNLHEFSKGDMVELRAVVIEPVEPFTFSDSEFCMRTLSIKRAQIEPSPMPKVVQEKKEGCFIATVCYGDYNSKEVLSLREYRDTTLSKTVFGKMFIRLYYFASPPTAKLIEKSSWMKKTIRLLILEPIVNRIGCNKKAANNA